MRAAKAVSKLMRHGTHGKVTTDALTVAQEGDGDRVEAVASRLLAHKHSPLADPARSDTGGGGSDPGHASDPSLELHVGEDDRQAIPTVVRPGEVPKVLEVVAAGRGVGEVRGGVVLEDGDVGDAETHVVSHAVLVEVGAAEDGVSTAHCVFHDVHRGHDVTAPHVTKEEMIRHQVQSAAFGLGWELGLALSFESLLISFVCLFVPQFPQNTAIVGVDLTTSVLF